ncbi:MAG: ribonuclease HII [Promethearchaeota archaeon]
MRAARVVAGIDEAGRGPVIGPMVVCGIAFPEEDLDWLVEIGVRDSKRLSPSRRESLAEILTERCTGYRVVEVPASEIDSTRARGVSLNDLEVEKFAEIVGQLAADIYYLDAADVNADRFGRRVLDSSGREGVEVVSEHKADDKYAIVGAASIVAKTLRDREIEKLAREVGEVGSGYPSDPKTKAFLDSYFREHGSFPDWVRRSWKTCENIAKRAAQTSLDEYW